MIGSLHVRRPRARSLERGGAARSLVPGQGELRSSPLAGGSVWARAARPSAQAQAEEARTASHKAARRESSLLVAINKLRTKLEPAAARQGMEWDDIQPLLMQVDRRTLEAAHENPESLLLLLSRRMLSRRRDMCLDGPLPLIGEAGEISINNKNTPTSPPRWSVREEASGERVSQPASPMKEVCLQHKQAPTRMDKVTRAMRVLYHGFNSIIAQFVLYVAYVLFFQALIAAVRTKEEVYLTKYLVDNIIEEPISNDYDNDQFMSIANLGDIDLFVSGVLLPALVVDTRMDESFKTPFEMAETFDNLDWSAGLMIKQVRVAEHSQGTCGTVETGAVMRWFAESQVYAEI